MKKNTSSHPEIEAKLIDLYENNYKDNDNFFSQYNLQNLYPIFEEISPIFLPNLTFGWYDLHKEGTQYDQRLWAYRNLIQFFKWHNEFKSKEFWLEWADRRTPHLSLETKTKFKEYVADNFPIKGTEYENFLESIKSKSDKEAETAHLVYVIEESIKYADKQNKRQIQDSYNYLTLFGY